MIGKRPLEAYHFPSFFSGGRGKKNLDWGVFLPVLLSRLPVVVESSKESILEHTCYVQEVGIGREKSIDGSSPLFIHKVKA
jgi:hypothetical protein